MEAPGFLEFKNAQPNNPPSMEEAEQMDGIVGKNFKIFLVFVLFYIHLNNRNSILS